MNLLKIFIQHQKKHFIKHGSINFIPAWIMLFITIITFCLLFPNLFFKKNDLISPLLLAFILGSLMPAFDDLFTFIFGTPFAHHSLFHSITTGPIITFVVFSIIGNTEIATYAVLGNLSHTLFNFTFDTVTFFFPLTYKEFGLTDFIKINTYWIKATGYPTILITFIISIIHFFRA